eukprot:scaffold104189_cov29-Tisochrysis_lutea.AAC.1
MVASVCMSSTSRIDGQRQSFVCKCAGVQACKRVGEQLKEGLRYSEKGYLCASQGAYRQGASCQGAEGWCLPSGYQCLRPGAAAPLGRWCWASHGG